MIREFTVEPARDEETAVVLCNGPSLREVNLEALPAAATFGMNAAYRHWNRIGWFPTHFACLDKVVGLHHAQAIGAMIAQAGERAPRQFLLRSNLIEHLGVRDDAMVSNLDDVVETGGPLARQPVTTGSHALLWAIVLGYRRIFLLGADCNYVEVVPGAEFVGDNVLHIVREDANPNYYFEDYQRPGDRYNLPNIGGETHLRSWRAAAGAAAVAGVDVLNLSAVSRCDAFDFADLDDFLAGRRIRVTPREVRSVRVAAGAVAS